jgi:hypothetical protein
MTETPKINSWFVPFFILMISLIVLPKAGVDLIQSNIRIQVEKTRQENLEDLAQLVRGNSIETAKLTHEIKLSQYLLLNQQEIKRFSLFQLSCCGLIFIGLIRSMVKQRERSTVLQNV